jgi:hypothetical protein
MLSTIPPVSPLGTVVYKSSYTTWYWGETRLVILDQEHKPDNPTLLLFHRLSIFSDRSYLTTARSDRRHNLALAAAADLEASYKAVDMSVFPNGVSQPYVLHTIDDPHVPVVVDTGASINVTPNVSDFVWSDRTT